MTKKKKRLFFVTKGFPPLLCMNVQTAVRQRSVYSGGARRRRRGQTKSLVSGLACPSETRDAWYTLPCVRFSAVDRPIGNETVQSARSDVFEKTRVFFFAAALRQTVIKLCLRAIIVTNKRRDPGGRQTGHAITRRRVRNDVK